MTHDAFKIHHHCHRAGDSIYSYDPHTTHQESGVVDTRFPAGHTGGVLQDSRACSLGFLLEDGSPEEVPRPTDSLGYARSPHLMDWCSLFLRSFHGQLRPLAHRGLVRLLHSRLGVLCSHQGHKASRHRTHGQGLPPKEVPLRPLIMGHAHRTHPLSAGRSAIRFIYIIVSQSFLSVEYS